MIALLSTLALAQELPVAVLPVATLPAATPMQAAPLASMDYNLGYQAGTQDGKLVSASDFALYGAGATFLGGTIGCCGIAAAAYMLEPSQMPPRSGVEVPDASSYVAIPEAPGGVDPEQWAYGYAAGWNKALQKKRVGRALLGGGAVSLVYTVTIVAIYVVAVGAIFAVGFAQDPLSASEP